MSFGLQAVVDWLPRFARIIAAECACGGDGDEDAIRVLGVEDDRVQAHSAPARLPRRTGAMGAESGKFLPVLPAIGGAEQSGVFHSRVYHIGIGQRGLEMPNTREFPGVRRSVVPHVRAGDTVVHEFIADWLPGLRRHPSNAG